MSLSYFSREVKTFFFGINDLKTFFLGNPVKTAAACAAERLIFLFHFLKLKIRGL